MILLPEAPYEMTGYVPNVVFPVTAMVDGPTGRIVLYCGAADTCTAVAFCRAEEVISFIKENSTV